MPEGEGYLGFFLLRIGVSVSSFTDTLVKVRGPTHGIVVRFLPTFSLTGM